MPKIGKTDRGHAIISAGVLALLLLLLLLSKAKSKQR